MEIKVSGIYSDEIWQQLVALDISHFGFCFIPTAFTFLQQYRFLQLAEKNFSQDNYYYFSFAQEKEYIIQKQIDDCQQLLDKKFGGGEFANHFQLVFSTVDEVTFCDSFGMGYWLPFDFETGIEKFRIARFLKGIAIDYRSLEFLHEQGSWSEFMQFYLKSLRPFLAERRIKLSLLIDWDSNIFPSIFESMHFDYLELEINSKIEISYRQINLERLTELVLYYKDMG